MKVIRRRVGFAAGCVAVAVVVVTACGESDNTAPTGGGPSGQGTVSTSAGPNPNSPENNPAGDLPDNQAYVPFTPSDNLFTVSVPEGWSQSTNGAATVFTDKFNTVQLDTVARATAPTVESARAEEVPGIAFAAPGYSPGSVSTVQRNAGPAVLITYQATSAANPVTGKAVTEAVERYEFWHDGHEVVLTLSGPQDADNVDPWRTITDSLQWP